MTLWLHLDCAVNSALTMCHGKSGSDRQSLSMSHLGRVKSLGPERRNSKSGRQLNSKPSF